MEISAHLTLSLAAVILMALIAVTMLLGTAPTSTPRKVKAAGATLLLAAVWGAFMLLDIERSHIAYYAATLLLIVSEVIYLIPPKREKILTPPTIVETKEEEEEESEDTLFAEVIKGAILQEEQSIYLQPAESELAAPFEAWIETKGYLNQGVTIQGVAAEIKSNRTYLSSYFNTKYNTSFREWVTMMRLEESKNIMRQNRDISIVELSSMVGFASSASFSRAFARQEGLSPAAWRNEL